MKNISDAEKELIETVKAHLRQIEMAATYDADEASLRVITNSLRFLLADENLQRAWRASGLGGPMIFKTWKIVPNGAGPVVAFCGGGDMLPGISFSTCRGASVTEVKLNLKDFCSSARVQVDSIKISATELIRYVANARGGSHYDPDGPTAKKPKAELLSKIESGEIATSPIRVNERSLLHHEILSISQSILRSEQVVNLRASRGS